MPNLRQAHLRHTVLYLQQLLNANDQYLRGNQEAVTALLDFDHNQVNIHAAQKWATTHAEKITDQEIQNNETAYVIVDLCNAFPDAGAYIINFRLGANERIQWFLAALKASQRLGNDVTTQAHLGNLGLAYDELGEFSTAIDYFEKALQLAEKIKDRYHQGAWQGNIGNIYSTLGNHHKAIEYHEHHLAIAREIQDKRGEGHALANLGVSLAYLGQSEKALEYYQQFQELAVSRGDRRDESLALLNIGLAYYDIGKLSAAENALKEADIICNEFNDLLTKALIIGGQADIYTERKEYELAIQTINNAFLLLDKTHRDVQVELRLLQSLGNAYNASDNHASALNTYTQQYELAKSIGAKVSMCNALANQTSIYRAIGDYPKALEHSHSALVLSQEIASLSNEAFIRWQLGLIYEAQVEKEKALTELKTAIQLEEKINAPELVKHRQYLKNLS